jgi:glycosyltransferase involved in cell wall biosynthesis
MDVKLIILGDGPMRDPLERLISELGLEERVMLPGFTLDPYAWYRSSDLFVLSSLWEGFGNVVVEALECGVPVVSTNCPGGVGEILDNGRYGSLVPVGDHQSLAEAIAKDLKNKHDHDLLKTRAKSFSLPVIAKQYLDYFIKFDS